MNSFEKSWKKLTNLAAQASEGDEEAPFGFATRVLAAWKSSPREGYFTALEGMTWRGVLVAAGVLGVCAIMGYSSLAGLFGGEVQSLGTWFGGALGL